MITVKNKDKSVQAEKNEKAAESTGLIGKDVKQILFFIVLLAAVIAVFFAVKYISENRKVITPDELHEKNLRGELDTDEGYMFNGFSFIRYGDAWMTKIKVPNAEGYINLEMRYGAREVQDVRVVGDPNYLTQFNSSYITFDPTEKDLSSLALAASDLAENMAKVLKIRPVAACTKNETAECQTRPIINCDKDRVYPVYYLRHAEESAILAEGNCITIQGEGLEIVKAVDRLILGWYGVIQ